MSTQNALFTKNHSYIARIYKCREKYPPTTQIVRTLRKYWLISYPRRKLILSKKHLVMGCIIFFEMGPKEFAFLHLFICKKCGENEKIKKSVGLI